MFLQVCVCGHHEVSPAEQTSGQRPKGQEPWLATQGYPRHRKPPPTNVTCLDSAKAQGIPYLLYIFSRIRTTVKRMITTTTMAAMMAPEPTECRVWTAWEGPCRAPATPLSQGKMKGMCGDEHHPPATATVLSRLAMHPWASACLPCPPNSAAGCVPF